MSIHSTYLSSNLWHTPSLCVQGTQGSRPVLAGAVAADPVWLARDGVQGAVSEALPSAGPSPAQYVLCTGHSHFYQHCVHIQACSEDTCLISHRDKANPSNDARRQPFFSIEKEELPRVGLEPTAFCILGRCSTS